MALNTRPGVTLINVCGADILVASREIWDDCSRIMPIPKLWAIIWRFMNTGKTDREFVSVLSDMLRKPEAEIRERTDHAFTEMAKKGFLIEVPDEESEHDGD